MTEIENQGGSRTYKGWKGAKLLWLVTHFSEKDINPSTLPRKDSSLYPWHLLLFTGCQVWHHQEAHMSWQDPQLVKVCSQVRTGRTPQSLEQPVSTKALNFFKQVQKTCVTHSMPSGAAACLRSTPWILAFVVRCEGCCQYNYYKRSSAHTVCSVPWVILRHS